MLEYIDERADAILQYFAYKIPNASLEYEHTAGMHRFVITRVRLTYSVTFPDWVLRTAPLEELKRTIGPAIDRILLGATPRRIWVGDWSAN